MILHFVQVAGIPPRVSCAHSGVSVGGQYVALWCDKCLDLSRMVQRLSYLGHLNSMPCSALSSVKCNLVQ